MILYLDTSALVKRYFMESHTDGVLQLWRQAAGIMTSAVAYAEAMAAFRRKERELPLDKGLIHSVIKDFLMDWPGFIRVEVSVDLNFHIDRLLKRYPLRGFDAIHLASGVLVHEHLADNLVFACFDQKLLLAAQQEGLKTFPAPPNGNHLENSQN